MLANDLLIDPCRHDWLIQKIIQNKVKQLPGATMNNTFPLICIEKNSNDAKKIQYVELFTRKCISQSQQVRPVPHSGDEKLLLASRLSRDTDMCEICDLKESIAMNRDVDTFSRHYKEPNSGKVPVGKT